MKVLRLSLAAAMMVFLFSGCGNEAQKATEDDMVLCTTYPMYYLTSRLLENVEGVTAERMITEAVSCLHDYTLTTEQMKKIERADLIVMNGCGLEDFMSDALDGVPEEKILLAKEPACNDPHYWLSPELYMGACNFIFNGLNEKYPEQYKLLDYNRRYLNEELGALQDELREELSGLTCRSLITFHDGFSWFADAFDLKILAAIEEEEGAEPSAAELKEICELIEKESIPAIFVEKNGSTNAAKIIAQETGVQIFTLDMVMDGSTDYFTAMRNNVQAVREALG